MEYFDGTYALSPMTQPS